MRTDGQISYLIIFDDKSTQLILKWFKQENDWAKEI